MTPQHFNIIRKAGDPNKVTLVTKDGKPYTIYKPSEKGIFIEDYGQFVKCAPYGNHFIFELPRNIPGWAHMCSCGSPAVMVGSNAYDHLGSPEGMMFVCQFHTQKNKHADGSS